MMRKREDLQYFDAEGEQREQFWGKESMHEEHVLSDNSLNTAARS